jgi:hypothetical protein
MPSLFMAYREPNTCNSSQNPRELGTKKCRIVNTGYRSMRSWPALLTWVVGALSERHGGANCSEDGDLHLDDELEAAELQGWLLCSVGKRGNGRRSDMRTAASACAG